MKIKNIILTAMLAGGLLSSCSDFDSINENPDLMETVNPGTMLDPVLYNMGIFNWKRYNSFTGEIMQFSSSSSSGGYSRYYVTESAGSGLWTTYYTWLSNIREMEKQAVAYNDPTYQAIALTLQSWVAQMLVDTFGDVPFSEACKAEEGITRPKFDNQVTVYETIISDLKRANALYNDDASLTYNTSGELLYKSDVKKWHKFNNSLLLRVLLRANRVSELEEVLENVSLYPVFESNDDAALLAISGTFPQEGPVTRLQDFYIARNATEFFIDNLNRWSDPRVELFTTPNTDGEYVGIPSGYETAPEYPVSGLNVVLATPPMKLVLFPYSEVEFIRAEAAQRGIISASEAEEAYNRGVEAAITQWGLEVPAGYMDNTDVKYDGTLERIMLQKYYALFFCDQQQWFEYLRTGLPQIPRGDGVPAGNYMPQRLIYPLSVQRSNAENYKAAVSSMGGDDFDIKLVWQK